jgi:hypothetical protein
MKKNIFIATVRVAIEAEDNATACDSISECLTGNLQRSGAIIDWAYTSDGHFGYTEPIDKGLLEIPEDGELFMELDDV